MTLYPSWIEIPAGDLARATQFYRAVFDLTDTPQYDEPPMRIIVLKPSEKSVGLPGVSLVHSPAHPTGAGGAQINFHVGTHAALMEAMQQALAHGGALHGECVVDMGDGTRYVTLRDSEGNISRFRLMKKWMPDVAGAHCERFY
jgi:predicted enzyme related to lactoylglutathione lyase